MRTPCDGQLKERGDSTPPNLTKGPTMSGPLRNDETGYHSPHRPGTSGDAESPLCKKSLDSTTTSTSTPQLSSSAQRREEIPAGNGHPPNRGSRACCFCWCCCCSCSWKDNRCLTVRNNEENNARSHENNTLEILNGDSDAPPTLEDIRAWGESFDKLMRCTAGRKVFRDFLKCEYSEENILFWLACEDLKREPNSELVGEKARIIYEDYISILSPKEVSLDSRVREVINRNMVEPSPHTFDEAQLQIYTLMHRDSYPRFVNSPMFKKLAQLNNSSRKESSA